MTADIVYSVGKSRRWLWFGFLVILCSVVMYYERRDYLRRSQSEQFIIQQSTEQMGLRDSSQSPRAEVVHQVKADRTVSAVVTPPVAAVKECPKNISPKSEETGEEILAYLMKKGFWDMVWCKNCSRVGGHDFKHKGILYPAGPVTRMTEGGWMVCFDEGVTPTKDDCLVYSFGVGGDYSFDSGMVKLHGCEVHQFDPTIKRVEGKVHTNLTLWKTGIHGTETDDFKGRGFKVRKLSTIRKELNHEQRILDVLKMDVESSEWSVFEDWLQDPWIKTNVRQMHFELHGGKEIPYKVKLVKSFELLGFHIYYVRTRHMCGSGKPPITFICGEFHLYNMNFYKFPFEEHHLTVPF